MSSVLAHSEQVISVEDYLKAERLSEVRHEYVGGRMYAMAGASDDHNRIAGNIFSVLHERLRGKRCEPFMADIKFKIPGSPVFYYPDVLVACDPDDNAKYFRERPNVVFEVLSADTERTDQAEKRFAYALVPSLKVYVIVSQEQAELTVLRRGRSNSWREQVIKGLKGTLKLPEIKTEIPLARIYERTRLS